MVHHVSLPEPAGSAAYCVATSRNEHQLDGNVVMTSCAQRFPRDAFWGERRAIERQPKVLHAHDVASSDGPHSPTKLAVLAGARVFLGSAHSANVERRLLLPAIVLMIGDTASIITWAVRTEGSRDGTFYLVLLFALGANIAFAAAVAWGSMMVLSVVKVVLCLNYPLIIFSGDTAISSDVLFARLAFVTPQVVVSHLRASDLTSRWITATVAPEDLLPVT
jgi:hypothetical protein